MAEEQKLTPKQIDERIRYFAEVYWRTADIYQAIQQADILHLKPITKTDREFAESLLERGDVKDYLLLMGAGDDGGLDGMISRLGVVRRMAASKQDYRGVKEADVEIAKLRGYTQAPEAPVQVKLDLGEMAKVVAFLVAGNQLQMKDITPQQEKIEHADG